MQRLDTYCLTSECSSERFDRSDTNPEASEATRPACDRKVLYIFQGNSNILENHRNFVQEMVRLRHFRISRSQCEKCFPTCDTNIARAGRGLNAQDDRLLNWH